LAGRWFAVRFEHSARWAPREPTIATFREAIIAAPELQVDAMALLSARVSRSQLTASAVAAQRARELRAKGVDIVDLAQGEPDFATPEHIIEAALRAAREGQTRYTPVDGTPELKEAIVAKFHRENGLDFKVENVAASTGGKQVLFNALMATLDPGDEVIIPAPSWGAYGDMATFAEGRPIWVATTPQSGFKLLPEQLEAAITRRSRWLMLNSPSNPSGAVYSVDELRALAAVLDRHPQVWAMVDDMYEHILFDGRRFSTLTSVAPQLAERTLIVNGVSKAYAMTGWRLGYAAGPAELVRGMARMQGQATLNPSSISQAAAVAALNGPQEIVRERSAEFERRRNRVAPLLSAVTGLGVTQPDGAFYFWVSCAGWIGRRTPENKLLENDADVTAYLLESGVSIPNGAGYRLSPYFRLSFAASIEKLEGACERVRTAGEKLQ
jgi:aspartate aminotransferase